MNLLLDTHIALWAVVDSPRLPQSAKSLILDETREVHVSAASIWEIAIKHRLGRGGRGAMPISGAYAADIFRSSGFRLIAVTDQHAAATESLPDLHADPFDRLLVSQALAEGLMILTADRMVAAYSATFQLV